MKNKYDISLASHHKEVDSFIDAIDKIAYKLEEKYDNIFVIWVFDPIKCSILEERIMIVLNVVINVSDMYLTQFELGLVIEEDGSISSATDTNQLETKTSDELHDNLVNKLQNNKEVISTLFYFIVTEYRKTKKYKLRNRNEVIDEILTSNSK